MFCFVDVPSQFGASLRAELMGLGKNPQIPYTRRTRCRATVQGFHSASRHVKLQVQDPENDFTNIWKRLETARLKSLKCLHSVYSILSFAWKAMIWFHRPRWSDAGHQSVWGHLEKSSQALEQIPAYDSIRVHHVFFIPFHPFPMFPRLQSMIAGSLGSNVRGQPRLISISDNRVNCVVLCVGLLSIISVAGIDLEW
jgi:hypothetical protein